MTNVEIILYICAAISTIGAAVSVISNMTAKVKEPYVEHTNRIVALETKIQEYDQYFKVDKKRLDYIEVQQSEMLKAMFALLSHATDNNDVERCRKAKNELQEFLVEKGLNV